jgi:hypothetical protein
MLGRVRRRVITHIDVWRGGRIVEVEEAVVLPPLNNHKCCVEVMPIQEKYTVTPGTVPNINVRVMGHGRRSEVVEFVVPRLPVIKLRQLQRLPSLQQRLHLRPHPLQHLQQHVVDVKLEEIV